MATVKLDREQREAIRREILLIGSAWGDIGLALGDGRDGPDRAYIIDRIAQLGQFVSVLDAIGWLEPSESPDRMAIQVDPQMAWWADTEARSLRRSLTECHAQDEDLDALAALVTIATSDGRDIDWGED